MGVEDENNSDPAGRLRMAIESEVSPKAEDPIHAVANRLAVFISVQIANEGDGAKFGDTLTNQATEWGFEDPEACHAAAVDLAVRLRQEMPLDEWNGYFESFNLDER